MVADTFHVKSSSPLFPTLRLLGQELGKLSDSPSHRVADAA